MSVVFAEARFARRRKFGTRVDEILHARGDMPVRHRKGWSGPLSDSNAKEIIVSVWLAAHEIEPAACCAAAMMFDDKSDCELHIACSAEDMARHNLKLPAGSIEVQVDGWCYIVSFSER